MGNRDHHIFPLNKIFIIQHVATDNNFGFARGCKFITYLHKFFFNNTNKLWSLGKYFQYLTDIFCDTI